MKNKFKIAIYLRLSQSDKTKDESNSITSQRMLITDYIKKSNNFTNYEIIEYQDDGCSGTNFDRPQVQRLIEDVRNNNVDCIIVKDISRFGRNYIEVGNYIENIFPFLNVRFISINDNYDSINKEDIGGIETVFRAIFADFYSKELSVKIKKTQENLIKNGKYMGKIPPMGYKKSPDNKYKLIPDVRSAWIVQYIFNEVASGKTKNEVARDLNQQKIPTAQHFSNMKTHYEIENIFWTYKKVDYIIKNEVYMGDIVFRKNVVKKIASSNVVINDKANWLIYENAHEPLVSRDVFELANSHTKKSNRGKSKTPPQTSIYKCGVCNHKLTKILTKSPHLKCKSYISTDDFKCKDTKIFIVDIKEAVLKSIKEENKILLCQRELAKNSVNAQLLNKLNSDISNSYDELQRWNKRLKELIQKNYMKSITVDEFEKQNTEITLKRDELNNNLITLKDEQSKIKNVLEKEKEYFALNLDYDNVEELNDNVMLSLVDEIVVMDSNTIKVKWKFKDEYSTLIVQ